MAVQDLEITALEAWPLREPVSKRSYAVLRLRTRSGLAGHGECRVAAEADLARARAVVLGRPATAYEVVRRELAEVPGLQAACNMALLDIVGQFVKAPVYQVLGGPTRNKVRVLAPIEGASEAALAASLKRAQQAGFRAFTVPAAADVAPLRSAAGGELDFVLDGAAALTPGQASRLATEVERFHPLWLDEPCRIVNLGAVRKISAKSVTPIGFGRMIHRAADFQDLLREDAIDVLRPDIALNGISQIRRMAALSETYYVAVAPYHDGGPIGAAAALHLAASLPNFFIQQIPLPEAEPDRRMRAELAGHPVESVRGGFAELPGGPGLGIRVRDEILEKYKDRGT
jgi:galactonate dehydratase